jgi:N-acetylglucosamine malate deacetylase 1
MLHFKKILVLAPHTDDGELGCGATIAKHTSLGKEVFYAAFSTCAQSLPSGCAADTLEKECRAATALLGVKETLFFDFQVREMPAARQLILEEMVRLNKELQPDLVLLPSLHDVHQDHQTVAQEAMRAFKFCSLAGFELPWNNTGFQPNYFETIEEDHLLKKQTALQAYQSQQHRHYMNADFIRSLALVRGVQANRPLAEAFELYRMIG